MKTEKKKAAPCSALLCAHGGASDGIVFCSHQYRKPEGFLRRADERTFVERIDEVATIYDLRFPRIIISMLAGAAIAVSGVLFQAVLKNPLADPGIIGISSGASFAAVLITALHRDCISLLRW